MRLLFIILIIIFAFETAVYCNAIIACVINVIFLFANIIIIVVIIIIVIIVIIISEVTARNVSAACIIKTCIIRALFIILI